MDSPSKLAVLEIETGSCLPTQVVVSVSAILLLFRQIVSKSKTANTDKILKQQSKITFNGFHKSYENYDSYTFKQNEVLMDKPIYLGLTILELIKLLMYET